MEFKLKVLGIVLLSLIVSGCVTTQNKRDYKEFTGNSFEKKEYETLVSKIGEGVDLDKHQVFSHFSQLLRAVGSRDEYNPQCPIVLKKIETSKNNSERPKAFDFMARYQVASMPVGISMKPKRQLIQKLSDSLDSVEFICKENSSYKLVDAIKQGLQEPDTVNKAQDNFKQTKTRPYKVKNKYCLTPTNYNIASEDPFVDVLDKKDKRLDWNDKALKIREPKYPVGAVKDKIEGYVIASAIVNEKGCYINIEIIESQPVNTFDASMIEALKFWRYSPALLNDKPVKVKTSIRFDFKLGKNN